MSDYKSMTIWELGEELNKIESELSTRFIRVVVDPTLPAGEMRVVHGPHRIRITNVGEERDQD